MLESGPGRMLPMTVPLMIANEGPANIAMRLGLLGPAFTAVTACSSGTDALGQALDLIRSGRCDAIVAGGAEAAVTEFTIGGFCRLQALSTKPTTTAPSSPRGPSTRPATASSSARARLPRPRGLGQGVSRAARGSTPSSPATARAATPTTSPHPTPRARAGPAP